MKSVGIAGSQERIGTTTQALQMVLSLRSLEYDAAYVEMSDQNYLKSLENVYRGVTRDKKTGCVLYKDIPMYSNEQMIDIQKQGYDFVIKDYGAVTSSGFEKLSFLEQDIKIIVGGVKANEIHLVEKVMEERCYKDVNYIFSFVAPEDRQDIKALMGDHKQNTYFAGYTPDPFTYQENDIYAYILGD